MQLAITVVYLARRNDGAIIDLHLRKIRENTAVPYRIYATVNRLHRPFRQILEAADDVEIVPCPTTRLRGGPEHSYYLTRLIQRAMQDGATHVVTLHVDSFPVKRGWDGELAHRLATGHALAAVAGEDPADPCPRTSCLLLPRAFWEEFGPLPTMGDLPTGDAACAAYARAKPGLADPGDPFGHVLWREELPWHRMQRSNAVMEHRTLAGVFDDLVFHLGAASRARKGLDDVSRLPPMGSRSGFRRALQAAVPLRWRLAIPDGLRRLWSLEAVALAAENRRAYEAIRERLLADPDGYLDYLRHGAEPDRER